MKIARPMIAWALPLLALVLILALMALNPKALGHLLDLYLFESWRHWAPATGAVTRPRFALPGEIAALTAAGAALIYLTWRTQLVWAGLFAAATILAGLYLSWLLYVMQHWLIAAATPATGLALLLLMGLGLRAAEVSALYSRLRRSFSDSLPRATIERIAREPELLSLDGQTRNVSYLVCGVIGVAELANEYRDDPKAFTSLISQMLSPLMDQALAHGGAIDHLTEDGFAAFWNAPLDDTEHALHACEAANGMTVMAARVNEHIANMRAPTDKVLAPLEIGIGLVSGPVIAGSFGGNDRLGYGVRGEAVALAGRLQALSPRYGAAVIVAEETQKEAARNFAFLEVDTIAAGRADAPLKLYAMLGNPVARSSPKFRALSTFHEHIFNSLRSQQWGKARELIEQCRKLSGASQALYDLHLARIRYYESNPPGPDWDGAFRSILK